MTVETPKKVAARIRRALPFVAPGKGHRAPDCGMTVTWRDERQGAADARGDFFPGFPPSYRSSRSRRG